MNNIIYVYKTSDETKDAYVVDTPTDEFTGHSVDTEIGPEIPKELIGIIIFILALIILYRYLKKKSKE